MGFIKCFKFLTLLQREKRIRVDRLAKELNVSERSIYRLVKAAAFCSPIYLDDGVVIWGGSHDHEFKNNG